jgi:hypothetical protein
VYIVGTKGDTYDPFPSRILVNMLVLARSEW